MLARVADYTGFVASGQTGYPPAQALNRSAPVFATKFDAGDTILAWTTLSNGGVAGGANVITDNVNAGNYQKLLQLDDTGGQASWYLYAMFNSKAASAGSLVLSCAFPVLIWQGLFGMRVAGVKPAPLITAAVGQVQTGVGTGANAISSGNIVVGAKRAIVIAGTMNTTIQAVTGGGPPSAGTTPAYTQLIQDLNWNTSGTPGAGPEGTPDLPSCCFEYLTSESVGTIPATFTAFGGDTGDSYTTIVVALEASNDAQPGTSGRRNRRSGGLSMDMNVKEWF